MTPQILVVLGAALASAVEMVEALTIVLAVGMTRGWRSAAIVSAPSRFGWSKTDAQCMVAPWGRGRPSS